MRLRPAALSLLVLFLAARSPGAEPARDLVPLPARSEAGEGALPVDGRFGVDASGCRDDRVAASSRRLVGRVLSEAGLPRSPEGSRPVLRVTCGPATARVQRPVEDESYVLAVTSDGARLTSPTPYGALRGMETFAALVVPGGAGLEVPAVTVTDAPRFPWRGLLLDSCRHFLPVGVVLRTLDGMAAVKLNVLHWHLTEDQGFRVESRRFPRLHRMGSDGLFYKQEEVRRVVAYARERGIRVVPEFDVPGHTTSWFVGHPELASGKGPYAIERRWGIFDPAMDPTRESTYAFLDAFLGEMARLFPDRYVHVGGDEVNGAEWARNGRIQAWMRRRGVPDAAALQAHFNRRVAAILARHGKAMAGWDEVLGPTLPKDVLVQSWRGTKALAQAAADGHPAILSAGWYLDHLRTASFLHAVEPLGSEAAALDPESRTRILGGEACMWAEYVGEETVDSRVWPRLGAVAERLWSPAEVRGDEDLYRRLGILSWRLSFLGLSHLSARAPMLARLSGFRPAPGLEAFADLLEAGGHGVRAAAGTATSLVPLNRLVDAIRPESEEARRFAGLVERFLADPAGRRGEVDAALAGWEALSAEVGPVLEGSPSFAEAASLAADLGALARLGRSAVERLAAGGGPLVPTEEEAALLARAGKPRADVLLAVAPPVGRLVEAAKAPRP